MERMVHGQVLEGLYVKALAGRIDDKCVERLRAAGLDLAKPLKPFYSFDVWMDSIRIAAEGVFPEVPAVVARNRLGRALIGGYRETLAGRAILGVMRILGPARTLGQSARNFRAGNNYTEADVKEIAAKCYELWMNEVGPYPEFTSGIVEAGIEESGGKNVRVELKGYDGHAATYRITWE